MKNLSKAVGPVQFSYLSGGRREIVADWGKISYSIERPVPRTLYSLNECCLYTLNVSRFSQMVSFILLIVCRIEIRWILVLNETSSIRYTQRAIVFILIFQLTCHGSANKFDYIAALCAPVRTIPQQPLLLFFFLHFILFVVEYG